jgi:hypothetical protein
VLSLFKKCSTINVATFVVTRGGFHVGNGINWKGQVFGRMRNWTANNRQTGVGNSLKKHYANFLWEYEQVRLHGMLRYSTSGGQTNAVHLTLFDLNADLPKRPGGEEHV